MRRRGTNRVTIFKEVDINTSVEVDVDFYLDDVKEFIDQASDGDIIELGRYLTKNIPGIFRTESLHDEMKIEFLLKIWNNITPFELEEKLKDYVK